MGHPSEIPFRNSIHLKSHSVISSSFETIFTVSAMFFAFS